MTSKDIETEPDAAKVALWRDDAGFSRITESEPGSGTFFVMGPDDLSHAVHCDFGQFMGILPCNCDATRRQYPQQGPGPRGRAGMGWWYRCWFRWQQVRVAPHEGRRRVPWPVEGPDGEPWVEGPDFTGDVEPYPAQVAPIRATSVEWGVRDRSGNHPVSGDFEARTMVESMRPGSAAVVCREVTDWRKADD